MISQAFESTIAPIVDWAQEIRGKDLYTFEQPFSAGPSARSTIDGHEVIVLTSSNYLGLTEHPEIRAAMHAALDQFGPSACGARLNNGTTTVHLELERRIAQWAGHEAALVYSSGYLANVGTISALCDVDTVIVTDQFNHMSILDGCKLAEGSVKIFAHNSMEKLEYALERNADAAKKFVVVDGVYSMDGEIAPLEDIHKLCERFEALLMVDEAHGVGVLGEHGRGAVEHCGVTPDLVMGTFSKSFAGVGGFVAGDARLIDYVRHKANGYLFNAALPAVTAAGVLKALEVMEREPWRRDTLWANTARFRSGLIAAGFDVMGSVTPIVPILIGDEMHALAMTKELLAEGLYVSCAIFPAVPKGMARFRATITAAMQDADIDRALELLTAAAKRHGVITG